MSDAKDLRAGIVPDILAILPLRGSVLMPHAVLPLGAGRASSVRLIEEAVQSGRLVGAVMQRDPKEDAPDQGGLFPVGTVTIIHKAMKQSDGSMRLVVQGLGRFRILEIVQREPYLRARVEAVVEDDAGRRRGAGGAGPERSLALREGHYAVARACRTS